MIKNFETVSAKMRDAMEQERLAEAILDTLIENGGKMRVMEIEDVIGEWTCQRIVAMLKKLMNLDLVRRVEIRDGEPIEVTVNEFVYEDGHTASVEVVNWVDGGFNFPKGHWEERTKTVIPAHAYFEAVK